MLMLQYQCYTFKKELDKEQSLQMCTCAYTVNTDITVCLQVTLGHWTAQLVVAEQSFLPMVKSNNSGKT